MHAFLSFRPVFTATLLLPAMLSAQNMDGLPWATYLGGGGFEMAHSAAALAPKGDIVLGGWTDSANFPITPGAFQLSHNGPRPAPAGFLEK